MQKLGVPLLDPLGGEPFVVPHLAGLKNALCLDLGFLRPCFPQEQFCLEWHLLQGWAVTTWTAYDSSVWSLSDWLSLTGKCFWKR
jgi:hypothetical protein